MVWYSSNIFYNIYPKFRQPTINGFPTARLLMNCIPDPILALSNEQGRYFFARAEVSAAAEISQGVF